jgi:CBS domain-containing protein
MKVREVAVREVIRARPEATLREVAALMRDSDVGSMPICEGTRLVGMITDRDIVITCAAMGNSSLDCQAQNFMRKNPITVSLDASLEEAAKIMAEKQVRRLPVLGGDRVVGILSLGDLALALAGNDKLVANTLRRISTPLVEAVAERRERE